MEKPSSLDRAKTRILLSEIQSGIEERLSPYIAEKNNKKTRDSIYTSLSDYFSKLPLENFNIDHPRTQTWKDLYPSFYRRMTAYIAFVFLKMSLIEKSYKDVCFPVKIFPYCKREEFESLWVFLTPHETIVTEVTIKPHQPIDQINFTFKIEKM